MRKPLTPDELERLAKLAAMPDEDIDTSDIPETTDEQWALAFRPMVRIDLRVVHWFKLNAPGGDYPREINRVLRRHVDEATKRRE